jgi:hypothetical protein
MSLLLDECPSCQATEFTYSNGVILNSTPVQGREYPVLKCCACGACFFAMPPNNTWEQCSVKSVIAFIDNPQNIDVNKKLSFYRSDLTFNVIPAF